MNRTEWRFEYEGSDLVKATLAKIEKHKGKLAWWENKKNETMKKVRESGIEIHDSVAASYSNTKGWAGPQITIDETLQRDLSECQAKILSHNNRVEEYQGWLVVLQDNIKHRYSLDHDDYLYFFGE